MAGPQQPATSFIGVGIALGVALGAGLGIALGNLPVGLGVGLALGVAFGVAMDANRKKPGKPHGGTGDGGLPIAATSGNSGRSRDTPGDDDKASDGGSDGGGDGGGD